MKTVIEIPAEDFQTIKDGQAKILNALESMRAIKPPEFLTTEEFREQTKTGKTWLFEKIRSGKIRSKHIGRRWYIPLDEVQRFFRGEITE
jgi:excisionase family DNA binding protein